MKKHGLENPYAERFEYWERNARGRGHGSPPASSAPSYFHVRDEALLAHATQIDPNGWFFAIPREVQAEAWPTEDYQLVTSHVETSVPEDDLFAGLR